MAIDGGMAHAGQRRDLAQREIRSAALHGQFGRRSDQGVAQVAVAIGARRLGHAHSGVANSSFSQNVHPAFLAPKARKNGYLASNYGTHFRVVNP